MAVFEKDDTFEETVHLVPFPWSRVNGGIMYIRESQQK